jgi:hypothetical protein
MCGCHSEERELRPTVNKCTDHAHKAICSNMLTMSIQWTNPSIVAEVTHQVKCWCAVWCVGVHAQVLLCSCLQITSTAPSVTAASSTTSYCSVVSNSVSVVNVTMLMFVFSTFNIDSMQIIVLSSVADTLEVSSRRFAPTAARTSRLTSALPPIESAILC